MSAPAQHKILLDESEMPTRWYNVLHDLPDAAAAGAAPRHRPAGRARRPGAAVPDGPDPPGGLAPTSTSRSPGRCSTSTASGGRRPLFRAHRLEKALGTPARIYYKYEGVSPAGSHKPNTAVPQAFYNAKAGIKKLTTETGAGQWGTALAFACAQFDLECEVWQVRASYDQKPYRQMMIETFGGTVHPSPSDLTEAGRAILAQDPDSTGLARHRDQRGGRGRRAGPDDQLRARQRAQPRADAPDDHRRGGAAPAGQGGRDAGPAGRAAPAAARTSAGWCSRSCARSGPAGWRRRCARSSRRRARR